MIFVFGSNLSGIHGAGAARVAMEQHGAKWRIASGHMGNSFAIPTKDRNVVDTLPLDIIKQYVNQFIDYAKLRPDLNFQVTRIGCGLAGLRDEDVAPLFNDAPSNCYFDLEWAEYLTENRLFKYWGTF